MAEVEIGIGKTGRRAYGFDEIAIVPSRRTRDPESVDLSWDLGAFRFHLPFLAAALDGVSSPDTAAEIGRLGGVAVLNLEGLWTRYDDPTPTLDALAELSVAAEAGKVGGDEVTRQLRQAYAAPVRDDLIVERIAQLRASGAVSCAAIRPQRTLEHIAAIERAELDLLVIQGAVVSAEHVSRRGEPLNLKQFIRRLDIPVIVGGCASYQAALHLMRTGAAGILVGVGAGASSTTRRVLGLGVPQATAVADARAARMRHLDETGVYVHVIADGGMATGGDIAKAVVCGADAVMIGSPLAAASEAPGRGAVWSMSAAHATLPRAAMVRTPTSGSLEQVLLGPASGHDGRVNLFGALRSTMAICGYETLKEFQKADLVVAPSLLTEGKPASAGDGASGRGGAPA